MSHVAKIDIEIKDLDTLKAACERLRLQFMHGQVVYSWYGRNEGNYPPPEGFSVEDLGRCEHAIRVPGAKYEVGVVQRGGKLILLWDFWRSGGLEEALGKGACRLRQAYAVERVRKEARLKGYRIREQKTEQGIRVVLTK